MSVEMMFCPRCGKAEQLPETYCRQCGLFLSDLSKPAKRERPPEEHLRANKILNSLTIVVSFTLAIVRYSILGFRSDRHPLIYSNISRRPTIEQIHTYYGFFPLAHNQLFFSSSNT